jgi:hypothetical protein
VSGDAIFWKEYLFVVYGLGYLKSVPATFVLRQRQLIVSHHEDLGSVPGCST